MMSVKELRLRVAEAKQRDVGYGIARIDRSVGSEAGLSTGDVIEIRGKKLTAATVWLGYVEEEKDKDIIRIDGHIRNNAGVSLNDYVLVKKAQVKEAQLVVLAPYNSSVKPDENFTKLVKSRLIEYPVVHKNIVPVLFFGNLFTFAVVQTRPTGITKITPKTKLVIQSRIVQEKTLRTSITYEDIGGLQEQIQRVREMIELPLRFPELFQRLGIEPPKGVLLYGPPGCGKTLLAKAVATESEANFITIKGPEVYSKWVGESEKAIRETFRKARQAAPAVIFLDEIESIAPRKDMMEDSSGVTNRVASQLLAEMDGIEELTDIVVIGATNRPDLLDPAILRPGRFDRLVYIPPPDERSRLEILTIYTRDMPLAEDVSLEDMASRSEGFSGADLESLCREAALAALRRDINSEKVTRIDFEEAFTLVKPSISPQMLREYERLGEVLRSSERPLAMIG